MYIILNSSYIVLRIHQIERKSVDPDEVVLYESTLFAKQIFISSASGAKLYFF